MRRWIFSAITSLRKRLVKEDAWRQLRKYKDVKIGKATHISFMNLDGIAPRLVEIGEYCVFAPKSVVLSHDASLLPTTGKYVLKKTIIGNRVFVGYGAVIMPGVIVGDNVVIGSNAVVTADVVSGSVVCGSPARRICDVAELISKREEFLVSPKFNWHDGASDDDFYNLESDFLERLHNGEC